jgi:predicted nuclease of predicted toxin-antitoxin system
MAEFLCKNGVTITHIPGVKTEEADRKIEQFIHHDLHHSFNSHYVVITHDNDFVSILREMQQRSSKNSKIIYTRLSKNGNKCTKALERMATHTINLNIDIISPPKKKSNIVSTSNVKVVENKKKNNIVVTQPAKTTKSVVVTQPAKTTKSVVVTQPVKIESDTNKKTLTKKVSSETTKKSIFNTSIKKLAKAISDATVSKVSDKKCNDYYIGSPIIFAPSQMIFI